MHDQYKNISIKMSYTFCKVCSVVLKNYNQIYKSKLLSLFLNKLRETHQIIRQSIEV
jgi:hypothetical protein